MKDIKEILKMSYLTLKDEDYKIIDSILEMVKNFEKIPIDPDLPMFRRDFIKCRLYDDKLIDNAAKNRLINGKVITDYFEVKNE